MEATQQLSKEEVDTLMSKQKGLKAQSYSQIDNLTPESLEVISRQATLNIGTIGHVSHGKTTLVRSLSGINTIKFQNEKVKNITIKLGYANCKLYRCTACPSPQKFKSFGSSKEDVVACPNEGCDKNLELIRHISFVDCPGHEILMSTMLTGAAVMDSAVLLIAGNMECPQPQTQEHLAAVEIMKLKKILIIQNKVDIMFSDGTKDQSLKNYKQIKNFIHGTCADNSPIIPCSAQLGYNVDAVCQYLYEFFPIPTRNLKIEPQMIIIRSFDVNKAGETAEHLQGGVVGGSVLQGVLKVGDQIEIRPGFIQKDKQGQIKCVPILSRILNLRAEQNELLYAIPGGLIGVGLGVDSSVTRHDELVGNILGIHGKLPNVYMQIDIEYFLLNRLMGADQKGEKIKVKELVKGERLKFNMGSTESPGEIIKLTKTQFTVQLQKPICTNIGEKAAFSRRIVDKFRLIGWGFIKDGTPLDLN